MSCCEGCSDGGSCERPSKRMRLSELNTDIPISHNLNMEPKVGYYRQRYYRKAKFSKGKYVGSYKKYRRCSYGRSPLQIGYKRYCLPWGDKKKIYDTLKGIGYASRSGASSSSATSKPPGNTGHASTASTFATNLAQNLEAQSPMANILDPHHQLGSAVASGVSSILHL